MRIHFEDDGRGPRCWQLDNNGVVVFCRQIQASLGIGCRVLRHRELRPGDGVVVRCLDGCTRSVRQRVTSIDADMTAESFSAAYPTGTPCRYFPVAGELAHQKTTIRSGAWSLGHGAVVVKIDGVAGGVDIHHLVMEA